MKKDMRKRILYTAMRIFAQKGFFETTVEDIACSAKIAKGTVYLYFKDKSEIYIAIMEEQLNSALKDLATVNEKDLTGTEKLRAIAEEWLTHSVEFHQLFPMISMENINQALKLMKKIKQRVFPIINKIVSEIAQIIDTGIKNGEFQKINPRVAAISFLNLVRTPFLISLFFKEKIKCCEEILELFFNGLAIKKGS
ncbi:MAG: TetR/AcrR family transcriptional regulator [bacterium]